MYHERSPADSHVSYRKQWVLWAIAASIAQHTETKWKYFYNKEQEKAELVL